MSDVNETNLRVPIRNLSTGVTGLDEVLGGGFPEFSFNLIAGGPGTGKTTLGHQIMFANARPDRRAVYFVVIGEPPLKMLRYQQQYRFFDFKKLGDGSVRFIHLGDQARQGGLKLVLESIQRELAQSSPALVVVDSFRAMARSALSESGGEVALTDFMQRLALTLTSYQATTFLLGEYAHGDEDSAVFTVADGLIWLEQAVDRNSVVRRIHPVKVRGQAQMLGLHSARITSDGFTVFPRLLRGAGATQAREAEIHPERLSTGVPVLDEMMGGGIPRGDSVLIAGPSGSGKSLLAQRFVLDGAARGENGVLAVFGRRGGERYAQTPAGGQLRRFVAEGRLELLHLPPLDLSIGEAVLEIESAVRRTGARRAVIDSVSGLELALAPAFRQDFRESLYRLIGALSDLGVTLMVTAELEDTYASPRFSPHGIGFMTDVIIVQRYLELEGRLRRALSVMKVHSSSHSNELREYEISTSGELRIGAALPGLRDA